MLNTIIKIFIASQIRIPLELKCVTYSKYLKYSDKNDINKYCLNYSTSLDS